MEVTSANFQEVLEELDEALEGSTFLSIDGEFTGLNSEAIVGIYDTPAQYYSKLRSGSMDFLLVQFGLAVFTYEEEAQRYTHRSYNFYVFPRPLNRTAADRRFMCQASCMSFLADQGFDFNKLFKHGIPYLTSSEEERLTKKLEEKQKSRSSRDDVATEIVPISDGDKPLVEDVWRIEEFVESGFEGEELTIDKCNGYIRRLVHQEARIRWPNRLKVESRVDGFDCVLVVKRMGTKEEEERREAERREGELAEVKRAVGFGLLMRKIADSGKLIVGHNMLLDLCHTVHQFFGHLPESYSEFKSLLHGLFPRLLDTKVICHSQELRESVVSSNLSLLFETVGKDPFRIPEMATADGCRSYSTLAADGKSHEAGYDAFLTGVCFVALANRLGSLQDPPVDIVLPDSPLLHPFLNKLLIGRLKDVPHINIAGDDPKPKRDHVFHLTFPKEWKFNDISQLFSPFGGIQVSWLSDTTAYVGLNRKEQSAAVVKSLKGKANVYVLKTYREYQASLGTDNNEKPELSEGPSKGESSGLGRNGGRQRPGEDDDGWETVTGRRRRKRRQRSDAGEVPEKRRPTFDDAVSWD